jgi:hypothetical protein
VKSAGLPRVTDAGAIDAGAIDAGPIDAGPVDAGPVDAGPVDAGPGWPALLTLALFVFPLHDPRIFGLPLILFESRFVFVE